MNKNLPFNQNQHLNKPHVKVLVLNFDVLDVVSWGYRIAECHKVKSHSSKNLFVKEFNKEEVDLIYDELDDSEKVL
jgi:hypothetical protein